MRLGFLTLALEHMLVLMAVLCIVAAVGSTSVADALVCCLGAIVAEMCAMHLHSSESSRPNLTGSGDFNNGFIER